MLSEGHVLSDPELPPTVAWRTQRYGIEPVTRRQRRFEPDPKLRVQPGQEIVGGRVRVDVTRRDPRRQCREGLAIAQ